MKFKFKVKDMNIATGGVLVSILNRRDAERLDIHTLDRLKVMKGNKIETTVVDIAESSKAVPPGKIGLFDEVADSLKAKDGDSVNIMLARKPVSLDYIKKKLDGFKLTKPEIDQIVWDIVHNKLTGIELTYFVSAAYARHMTLKETGYLTKAMASHGDTLRLRRYPIMDKHCIGGVPGNRTTMVVVPLVAAAGLTMPKTSSRSITSPAGTADTMEVLADISLSLAKMKKIVMKTNGCIVWGGALNLAPADDKIIRVEKPMEIDAKSQLLASVMAKKASVSATHLLVDIPYGRGAKIESPKLAHMLKCDFEEIGKELGMRVKVIMTDGRQPIGNGIGAALEARDVLWLLKNDERAPADLRRKSLMLAGTMLEMAGKSKKGNGYAAAKELLDSGAAYKKMVEIIKAQGKRCTNPDKIPVGKFTYDHKARRSGKIRKIRGSAISKVARVAGAPKDTRAGIYLYKHLGDRVKKGEKIFTIHAQNATELGFAKDVLRELDGIVVK
jgi:putative thymidine phosphorylase